MRVLHFIYILLKMCMTIKKVQSQSAQCELNPSNVDKVDVMVYINGETEYDDLWYSRYCSWRDGCFPNDQYAPVTVKVGAQITCDENNECNCPNANWAEHDCTMTFENVCAEKILGQEEFKKLLCCSEHVISETNGDRKGFKRCVNERAGLAEQIETCMAQQGPGSPQDVALKHAKEVVEKGVDLANNTEPFFFYNEIFDKCISDDSPAWFLQKICTMLKFDIAKTIKGCVAAMGWKNV